MSKATERAADTTSGSGTTSMPRERRREPTPCWPSGRVGECLVCVLQVRHHDPRRVVVHDQAQQAHAGGIALPRLPARSLAKGVLGGRRRSARERRRRVRVHQHDGGSIYRSLLLWWGHCGQGIDHLRGKWRSRTLPVPFRSRTHCSFVCVRQSSLLLSAEQVKQGMIDRGAEIGWLSLFPHEVLRRPPHTCLGQSQQLLLYPPAR